MGFIVKSNDTSMMGATKRLPFYKKRGRKIIFIVTGLILVLAISLVSYILAKGSKIFSNGLGISGSQLIQTLTGQGVTLKGQKEDRINILLLGMSGVGDPQGGTLADSIMVLSIQPNEKRAATISIPRDLLVSIPGYGEDKINSSFKDGYEAYISKNCSKKPSSCQSSAISSGASLTSTVVSNTLGIPIHYYVTADFDGFEKVIDELGGVDIYVDKAIYDPSFPSRNRDGYSAFRISAGQHHMDGTTALKYARSRETTSDFDRAARQQKVVAAVKEKAVQIGWVTDPQKLISSISILGDSIKTSFTPAELRALAAIVKDVDSSSIISKVLSSAPDGLLVDFNDGIYYLKPKTGNFKQIQNFINGIFTETIPENAKISISNASKTGGLGTTLSKQLIDAGYNVTSVTSASTKSTKSVIYDYSQGKDKNTISYLTTQLQAPIEVKQSGGNGVDILIVIGDDSAKLISSANGISSQSKD